MQTKPFTNMFGREVQLTRDQFIDRWNDKTEGFMGLFLDHGSVEQLQDFKRAVNLLAGIEWDKSK
jgi:hypothetical protein